MTSRNLIRSFLGVFSALVPVFATSARAAACSDALLGLADTVSQGTGSTIVGTIRTTSAAPVCGLPVLPTYPAAGTGKKTILWGATGTIDTSFHDTLLVRSGGFLVIKPGQYRIASLTMEWGATLRLDTTGISKDTTRPGIQLVIMGDASFYDQASTSYPGISDSLAATRIAIVVPGAKTVSVGYDCKIKAQLIAPQANLVFMERVQFLGRFLARKATLGNSLNAKFAASGLRFAWDKDEVVINGSRRFWSKAVLVAVSWKLNGVAQTTQLTETLRTTDGVHWIKRCAGVSCDSVQVVVDRTAPVIVFQAPLTNSWTNKTRIQVKWTADGAAKSDSTTLVEGSNSLTRTFTDSAVNVGSKSIVVKLDTKVPVVAITSPATNSWSNKSKILVKWTVDGVAQQDSVSLVEGSNTVKKTSTDSAGNVGSASIVVKLDTKAPVVAITSPATNSWSNKSKILVKWTVDGAAKQDSVSLVEGSNTVKKTSTDSAGNVGSKSIVVKLDTKAPVVAITSPLTNSWSNKSKILVKWTVDGVAKQDSVSLVEGSNTVKKTWTDSAGNVGSKSIVVKLDTKAPVVAITSPLTNSWSNKSKVLVKWTVDGVAKQDSVSLVDGSNTVKKTFTDSAGNVGSKSIVVKLDTKAPVVKITSPQEGATLAESPVTVQWTLDGVAQAAFTQALTEGANKIVKTVTDSAANSGTATVNVTYSARIPEVRIIAPVDGYQTSADSVTVVWSVDYRMQPSVRLPLVMGSNLITRTSGLGKAEVTVIRTLAPVDTVKPGTEPVPTPVNLDLLPTFQERMDFLFKGPNAVQTGVVEGTLPAERLAVVRGRVLTREGAPLPGVTVAVVGRPEWGKTKTRADGWYDMAIAVGGRILMDYQRPGVFPVQRMADVSINDFGILPEVRMLAQDTKATAISLGGATQQVVVGSPSTDADGTRTPVVLFPAGTTASIIDSNGVAKPVSNLTIRATEYTVGPNGPQMMPGELPPGVAYTYAIELSADEAVAQKARGISFSQPVPFYVDNFLNFPVGIPVPLGYYDRIKGVWVGSESGIIVKVVSVVAGRAKLDVNGDGLAEREDSLLQNGWTAAELDQLGARYTAGKSLWRVKLPHFSAWDANWGVSPPEDAESNKLEPIVQEQDEDCDIECGSVVGVQDRRLGEVVVLPGTGTGLAYSSARAPGVSRYRTIIVRASGDTIPASLIGIEVVLKVAGMEIRDTLLALPNQEFRYAWDGLDAYGRPVTDANIQATVRNLYNGVYRRVERFGYKGNGEVITGNREGNVLALEQESKRRVPGVQPQSWSFADLHRFDSDAGVVFQGDGSLFHVPEGANGARGQRYRSVINVNSNYDDPPPVEYFQNFAPDPSGDMWVVKYGGELQKISTKGKGAVLRRIVSKIGVFDHVYIENGGRLYVAGHTPDSGYIAMVDSSSGEETVLYSRAEKWSGQGNIMDVNDAGDVVFVDAYGGQSAVHVIHPDGGEECVFGCGNLGSYRMQNGDTAAKFEGHSFNPRSVAWQKNGNMLVGGFAGVIEIDPQGLVRLVTCNIYQSDLCSDYYDSYTDGMLAANVGVYNVASIVLSEYSLRGVLFIDGFIRLHFIDEYGRMYRVSGGGQDAASGSVVGTSRIAMFEALHIDDFGDVYMKNSGDVMKFSPSHEGMFSGKDFGYSILHSASGTAWNFDKRGRHYSTVHVATGDTLVRFEYDVLGRVTKRFSPRDTTTVEYPDATTMRIIGSNAPDGSPRISIVRKDAEGNVISIETPKKVVANGVASNAATTNVHTFAYKAGGLLESYQSPIGETNKFQYDASGALDKDIAPSGLAQQIVENRSGDLISVKHISASGEEKVSTKWTSADTSFKRIGGANDVSVLIKTIEGQGKTITYAPNGQVVTTTSELDPQWGAAKPLVNTLVTHSDGTTQSVTRTAYVELENQMDPLSLIRRVDTTKVGDAVTISDWTRATRTLRTVGATGQETITKFDGKQRVTERTTAGDSLRVSYDDAKGIETWIQNNRTTKVWRNRDGQVDSVLTADGDTLRYVRDENDQPVGIPQPGGQDVKLEYDKYGRLIGLTPSGKPKHQFVYNQWGGDSLYTPPMVNGADGQVKYTYDTKGRMKAVVYSNTDTVKAEFDDKSRWKKLSFTHGNVAFTYGQPSSPIFTKAVRTLPDGGTQTLDLSLSSGGFGSETWSGEVAGSVTRSSNMQGFLGTMNIAGTTIEYTYPMGGVAIPLTAGDAQYNYGISFNALQSVTLDKTKSHLRHQDQGYGPLLADSLVVNGRLTYLQKLTYHPDGRIASKTEQISPDGQAPETVKWDYRYSNGRLAGVDKNGTNVASYGWDGNGNRSGSLVDDQDRYISGLGSTWSYDALGHLKTRSDSRGNWTFTYDGLWNLVKAEGPQSIGYVVDARGRRVGRKVGGSLVQGFLYGDQLKPVAELDGTGAVVSRFVYGSRAHVPDYMIKGGVKYRLVSDHLGSVRLVINSTTGEVASRIDYDVWGNIMASTNLAFQPFGFAGGLRDDATGLVRFGARDYDPLVGRWTGRDPISFAGGLVNLYGYAANDPVNWIDPSGLKIGDRFGTADEAAYDALKQVNPLSIDLRWEIAGSICQDGDRYFSTDYSIGGCNSSTPPKCPRKTPCVGDWHTHGGYSVSVEGGDCVDSDVPIPSDDDFSSKDIEGCYEDSKGVPGYKCYLGTPSGMFWKMPGWSGIRSPLP